MFGTFFSKAVSAGQYSLVEEADGYDVLERAIAAQVSGSRHQLFTTDVGPGLFDYFLSGISQERRQHYNCRCCARFMERYGGLVWLEENGVPRPLIAVNDVPPFFGRSMALVVDRVIRSKVTGVFYSADTEWGNAATPDKKRGVTWTHFHGIPDSIRYGPCKAKTADQAMAEKLEEYSMLRRALGEFSADAIRQAVRVLEADAISRSEKCLGVAKWFLKLREAISKLGFQPLQDNLVWMAVASAPPGWCHIRSTMIGTLLDDILSGLPYEDIARRWAAKMHPLQYQRPQAPPKLGTIKQAEELVEKLGCAKSLERRFARFEDVPYWEWLPEDTVRRAASEAMAAEFARKNPGGVFDHLRKAKEARVKALVLPTVQISRAQLLNSVLLKAEALECFVPRSGPFYGMVTAAHGDAPPILQWDGLKDQPRNPASWYFYSRGSEASQWGLLPNTWVQVRGITICPAHWQEPLKFSHHAELLLFVLDGARDSQKEHDTSCGGGIFPECLRSEYHGIRAVLEAHSKARKIEGWDTGTANGIALQRVMHRGGTSFSPNSVAQAIKLRTTDKYGQQQEYDVVRWE